MQVRFVMIMQRPKTHILHSGSYHPSSYSKEEVRSYISEIRLLFNEKADGITDAIALELIENHIFSCDKSHTCSFWDNYRLIQRLLSGR